MTKSLRMDITSPARPDPVSGLRRAVAILHPLRVSTYATLSRFPVVQFLPLAFLSPVYPPPCFADPFA